MNIFDVLACFVICFTILVTVTLLLKAPLKIEFIRTEKKIVTPMHVDAKAAPKAVTENELTKLAEDINKHGEVINMDNVIKNVNEMMGVPTDTQEGRD